MPTAAPIPGAAVRAGPWLRPAHHTHTPEGDMRKLKLELEDLRIDSFTTTPSQKEKGTVLGEQCTCPTACTCPGCPTCDASCNGTCGGTCDASCNGTCDASCNGTCGYSCDSCGASCGGPGDSCYQTCALYSGCTPYNCL